MIEILLNVCQLESKDNRVLTSRQVSAAGRASRAAGRIVSIANIRVPVILLDIAKHPTKVNAYSSATISVPEGNSVLTSNLIPITILERKGNGATCDRYQSEKSQASTVY